MAVKQTGNSFSLTTIGKNLKQVPKQVFDHWRSITPIKSGNARRSTRLDNNKTIRADYDYAVPLDRGHSRQAPQGMSKPTERFLKRLLKKQ